MEWLGDVPTHWCIPQIKRTTYLKARVGWKGLTSDEFREQAFAYLVTGSDFREKFVKWDECYQVEQDRYEDDPFIQLQNGDLLITKDGTIGKLAIVSDLDRPACLNSGIFVVRPRNTYTTEFMYWILSSSVFSVFCDLESFGSTINHLYQNVFERFTFPAPSESEQTQITAFLDRETAKIDDLVAEQRRLMELLKEKRQAVISHAVTRGLNPNAPMKPSGIEWLGDVPEGWEVLKLKFLCKVQTGGKDTENAVEDGKYPFFVRSQTVERINSMAFDCEAVLTAGDGVGVGKVFHYHKGPFDFHQRVYMMSDFGKVSGLFFFHYLRENFFKVALEGGAKSTVDSLRRPMFMNFPVCVPSVSEQSDIVNHVEIESSKFDNLTAEAQRAIALLQERRTALISAAVTGQIDIRVNYD